MNAFQHEKQAHDEKQSRLLEIVASPYRELDDERRAELESLAKVEFGAFAIVRETTWATPDYSFLGLEGAQLVCFYNLVLRTAQFDGVPLLVAGLNNLITIPAFRRQGWASKLLRETQSNWFSQLGAQCGLLLCADALLPFYGQLGWQCVGSTVRFAQPTCERVWASNCMLFVPDESLVEPREIDLGGLPW